MATGSPKRAADPRNHPVSTPRNEKEVEEAASHHALTSTGSGPHLQHLRPCLHLPDWTHQSQETLCEEDLTSRHKNSMVFREGDAEEELRVLCKVTLK